MTKWEYRIEYHESKLGGEMTSLEETEYLNEMGKYGWECYQSTRTIYHFKRPILETKQ